MRVTSLRYTKVNTIITVHCRLLNAVAGYNGALGYRQSTTDLFVCKQDT